MTVFGLVHGSWQAGWVWSRLIPELERLGHDSIAVDLPCDDPNAGAADYASTIVDALAGHSDDVVLVGHSLGGLSIPLVAERRPVAALVFLAAGIPRVGRSYVEQTHREGIRKQEVFDQLIHDEHGCTILPSDLALEVLYNDCEPKVARWAAGRLRYQAQKPMTEVTALTSWPSVHCAYVVCDGDRILNADWQRRAARERFATQPYELSGDHSPMLSAPQGLAQVLDDVWRRVGGA